MFKFLNKNYIQYFNFGYTSKFFGFILCILSMIKTNSFSLTESINTINVSS